jgi:CPA2 family monovalent cation:H+ antiporter-2
VLEQGEILLKSIVVLLLSILLISLVLKRFRQPYFSAYILAGILLGPQGLSLFTNVETIGQIGSLGLIMQMFFIGVEIEPQRLLKNIRISVSGVIVQLVLSFLFVFIIGRQFKWNIDKVILFSFIISLSSTAIILEYLNKTGETHFRLGQLTTGILLVQDFLLVPMIMVLNFLGKGEINITHLIVGVIATLLFVWLLRKIVLEKKIELPGLKKLQSDHELQVFIGLLICFGFAWITSLMHLSAAMGAMFAGMLISQTNSMKWLDQSLIPFRVFFISFFFLSIGLQLDFDFIQKNVPLIGTLVALIFGINSLINALVFRLLNENWKNSLYAGALLSQIGEFSLVLCVIAKDLSLVDNYSFQLTLAVISLTMLLSAGWIIIIRTFLFRNI